MAGLIYVAIGLVLLWVAWRSWKLRKTETISLIEAAILRASGEEPLPRTATDRALAYFQAGMGFLLGPVFMALGALLLFA